MDTTSGKDALRYLANCSLLFNELPLLERPAAAKAAGFDAVEFWWPFTSAVPSSKDVEAFIRALGDADISLIGLNFFAGDLAGPDAGVLSIPAHSEEFRESVILAVSMGERLGVRCFNALYGNRVDGVDPGAQDELAMENLTFAAERAARIHATVLIEPLSGPKPYPLRTAEDAGGVVDRLRAAGTSNVAFLCDIYHLASNGVDVSAVIREHGDKIGHVQIADVPGRGESGSGALDVDALLNELAEQEYGGWVSLEYTPTTSTVESLDWLSREVRGTSVEAGT
jgi:hydroxypyruvate isomerase